MSYYNKIVERDIKPVISAGTGFGQQQKNFCNRCGDEFVKVRTWQKDCRECDSEKRVKGRMVWEHKTAPVLEKMPHNWKPTKGRYGAQLPLGNAKAPDRNDADYDHNDYKKDKPKETRPK